MESVPVKMLGKRSETYSGVTDAGGDLVIVFAIPFPATPGLSAEVMPPSDGLTRLRITARSATGCTVHAERNASVNLLATDLLSLTLLNVAGVGVSVLAVEA